MRYELHSTDLVMCNYLFWIQLCAGASSKQLPVNAGRLRDVSSIPGWGRSPVGGHGNPL